MALIKKINVGGTTHDIGIDASAPLIMSGDGIRLNIGSGLHANDGNLNVFLSGFSLTYNSGIAVKVGSGLKTEPEGVSLLLSGADSNFNRGLEFVSGMLSLKLGSGLKFNTKGAIDLA